MIHVGHTVMVPMSEYEEMKLGLARYEFVRALNPQEFTALYSRALKEDIRWDDLIDNERWKAEKARREAPFKYSRELTKRRGKKDPSW